MTTTMDLPVTWNITDAEDSTYFDTGEPIQRPDPGELMPTGHFLGVLAIPVVAFIVPVVATWQGMLSWWLGIPLAILAPILLGFAAIFGYDVWTDRRPPSQPLSIPPSEKSRRTPQLAWRNDIAGIDNRQHMQRHLLERANQPAARTLNELDQYRGEQWWQRKAATAAQLRELDQESWRSYAKLAEHDHVASGPAGIFSIHDLHADNITVIPSPRPQLDVPAIFDSAETALSLMTVDITSPSWMSIAPVSTTAVTFDLNALPHQTSSCSLATTHDDRSTSISATIPASALETDLLETVAAAGVSPDEYHIVLVAHGATMSNPAEYVELSYSEAETPIGGAWLVHPNHLTAFLDSRPTLIDDEATVLHGHQLAADA